MKAFISHSSIDKPFVERLAADLRTRGGIDGWLDKLEILPGDSLMTKIEEGLKSANIFVLVLSPESVTSDWVTWERNVWHALEMEEKKLAREQSRPPIRRLIPILYKNCEIPDTLKHLLYIEISDKNYDEGFQKLVGGMQKLVGEMRGESTPASVTSLPTVQSSESNLLESPEDLALELLQRLRPPQFKKVIFYYKSINEYDLPDANASQAEKAMEVVRLAVEQEGASLSKLLNTIYKVAPYLKK